VPNASSTQPRPRLTSSDFARRPAAVIWEATRAGDPAGDPAGELSTAEAMRLMDEVRAFGDGQTAPPRFELAGDDPLARRDVVALVAYGARLGLRVAMRLAAAAPPTRDVLARLQDAGLARLAVPLAVPLAARVDDPSGTTVLRAARGLGLATQVDTTIARPTLDELVAIAALVADVGAARWSVCLADASDAGAAERVLEWLAEHAERAPFDVETTGAPQYRRVRLQRQVAARRADQPRRGRALPLAPTAEPRVEPSHDGLPFDVASRGTGVNDGNGLAFVDHRGIICPSACLRVPCGDVRGERLRDVYRDHPTFVALRDADALGGKCGMCEFRHVCGGSRARAYAMTDDLLAADPLCAYRSPRWQRWEQAAARP